MATVRYIASDVTAAAKFYAEQLGFHIDLQPALGSPCSAEATFGCC